MKKCYSVLVMLAMMVAALSFTACGGSDDEEDGGGIPSPSSSMTIRINGVDWAASTENLLTDFIARMKNVEHKNRYNGSNKM